MRIINELTAAALHMVWTEEGIGERNVLIYGIGEGTCDVSLLPLEMASLRERPLQRYALGTEGLTMPRRFLHIGLQVQNRGKDFVGNQQHRRLHTNANVQSALSPHTGYHRD